MKFRINPGPLQGEVTVPSSKSHTIRAVFFAALADGVSTIHNPLDSADAASAMCAVSLLGADVEMKEGKWIIEGNAGKVYAAPIPVDVGNSGTTARFVLSLASLGLAPIMVTGDEHTKKRPMSGLLVALSNLGVKVKSVSGKLPATVEGPLGGGVTEVDGATSQFLSSLLIHAPLAPMDTTLKLKNLNEKPYVDMTIGWLDELGIKHERDGYSRFSVSGRQRYKAFEKTMPGDFSSSAFFACLGAIPGNKITLRGLDMNDSQGDKAIFDYLAGMGAKVEFFDDRIVVTGDNLKGADLDLNATPDALPALAALASIAEGVTTLGNVPQARIKETDRIAVMAEELGKMGVTCRQTFDSLIVQGGKPGGASVSGHGDHRIVMSLAVAATQASAETVIDTAEAVNITFPTFAKLFAQCGGKITEA